MELVHNTTNAVKNTQADFANFNKALIITAAAVCIGLATKDTITDIMNEILLPLLTFVAQRSLWYFLYSKAVEASRRMRILKAVLQAVGKLIWFVLLWFVVLYITYFVFKHLIHFDPVTKQANLVDYVTTYVAGSTKRS